MKASIKFLLTALGMFISLFLNAQSFEKGDIILKTNKIRNPGVVDLISIENLYDTTVLVSFINEYEYENDGNSFLTYQHHLEKNEIARYNVTFNVVKARPIIKDAPEILIERYSGVENEKQVAIDDNNGSKVIDNNAQSQEKNPKQQQDKESLKTTKNNRNEKNEVSKEGVKTALSSVNILRTSEEIKSDPKFIADSIDVESEANNLDVSSVSTNATEDSTMTSNDEKPVNKGSVINWKMICVCGGALLLGVVLLIWYRKTQKAQQLSQKKQNKSLKSSVDSPSLIIVGQKTMPTLKKQNIDDVYDNETYLKIDSNDFCDDSAVRTVYIKNKCIKDIYNMYAEDLRNPDNPKEDGCMVLGRWVFDESAGLYDVTLEYIVLPGDDAVFAEYELNFGGKIKLKMSEKLRKLRRETDLQYDLTCWVHSHPGLGVFFSNSDNNVHMQLKHPVHPKFLTAFVIDILTPEQEMGIFTFKQDESVNSKSDITKMYSLEELYKWALASERKSFDSNNYYDVLGQINFHVNDCYGIQLSNGAIIDMSFLTVKQNGFMGFVHGFIIERGDKIHCITNAVTSNETAPDSEMLGCFVVASHCSIPSIRKIVSEHLRKIRFVLVYTETDGLLTAIPVMNQDICTNEAYYGEQKLEDLKIWTRRRR